MSLRRVTAVRYVAPLREGGSLPALMEADDGAQYVVKLRGAGQGVLPLAAEVLVGEIARRLALPMPEIVLVELAANFGRSEPDTEIRELLAASVGTNVGLAFLQQATTFDAVAKDRVAAGLASSIVWLDAFTMNVDRTSRNPNLMMQHGKPWLIDHGAALYVQHDWPAMQAKASSPFAAIAHHVLLPWAAEIENAGSAAEAALTPEVMAEIVSLVPDDLLVTSFEDVSAQDRREGYAAFFRERLQHRVLFEQEAQHARTKCL
jgi:hypothetical protein